MIEALRALDPTAWGLPLSAAMARATWADAVDACAAAPVDRPDGVPPRRVAIVASANVYTAPLGWMVQLRRLGVEVVVKPARGHAAAVGAMARAVGAEVRAWTGGDLEAEARGLADAEGVIAFGGAETIAALRGRLTVPFLGFGPRFGIHVLARPEPAMVDDVALFDGRGCMSPAASFVDRVDLDELAGWMADAEARWPRGEISAEEAIGIRTRVALARALGEVREGPGWAVLSLPADRFSPVSLPRVLVVHPRSGLDAARPYLATLGTVAGEPALPAPRHCAVGQMQRPPVGRWHEGVDVLGALWR